MTHRSPARECRAFSFLDRGDRIERSAFASIFPFEVRADEFTFVRRSRTDVLDDFVSLRAAHRRLDVFLPVSLVIRHDLQPPAGHQYAVRDREKLRLDQTSPM